MPALVPVWPAQLALRGKLIALAQRAGVGVIDPMATLCEASGCRAATPDGEPLYKDAGHLRAGFIGPNASFLDATFLSR